MTLSTGNPAINAISTASPNTAPVLAKPQGDVYIGSYQNFSVQLPTGMFSDADAGDVLHYNASLGNYSELPSWLQFDATTHTLSTRYWGYYRDFFDRLDGVAIRVNATDNGGLTATSVFHLISANNFGQQFNATANNDPFNGSNLFDVAVYDGNRANYTITRSNTNSYTVTQAGGSTDVLTNIERLQFADGFVAIDITGHGQQIVDDHAGMVYGLYQVAFNRAPDPSGFSFWLAQLDLSQSVTASIMATPEFANTHNNLSNADFVTMMYQNGLHRAPDAGGRAFWEAGLNSGTTTRERVLDNFMQADEFQATLVAAVGNGIAYSPWHS